jgi:predicted transposase/invertase (TIGR01784 family)
VFLNTKGHVGEVSRELKAFLNFVEKSTVENALDIKDSYVKRLSTRIEAIKKDEELGGRFMTLEERMDEIREDGIEQGIKHGSLQIAKEMKEEGFSIEQIVKLTKLSKEEIESL